MAEYIEREAVCNGGFRDHGLYTNRVTHWKPLPEPPEEET